MHACVDVCLLCCCRCGNVWLVGMMMVIATTGGTVFPVKERGQQVRTWQGRTALTYLHCIAVQCSTSPHIHHCTSPCAAWRSTAPAAADTISSPLHCTRFTATQDYTANPLSQRSAHHCASHHASPRSCVTCVAAPFLHAALHQLLSIRPHPQHSPTAPPCVPPCRCASHRGLATRCPEIDARRGPQLGPALLCSPFRTTPYHHLAHTGDAAARTSPLPACLVHVTHFVSAFLGCLL
jgi:hypothetical protein